MNERQYYAWGSAVNQNTILLVYTSVEKKNDRGATLYVPLSVRYVPKFFPLPLPA